MEHLRGEAARWAREKPLVSAQLLASCALLAYVLHDKVWPAGGGAEGGQAQATAAAPPGPPEGAFAFAVDAVLVTHPKDSNTLEPSLRHVLANVDGLRKVWVISPDDAQIRCLTHVLTKEQEALGPLAGIPVEWVDERTFPFKYEDVKALLPKSDAGRVGWYLQQGLKLYAHRVLPVVSPNVLIVDSDVVFMKRQKFIVRPGVQKLAVGHDQNHGPYFAGIKALTQGKVGRIKKQETGIAHHMLFQVDLLEELFRLIEEEWHPGKPMWHTLFSTVPRMENISKLSEYELYFNWVLRYHPDRAVRWYPKYKDCHGKDPECDLSSTKTKSEYLALHTYSTKGYTGLDPNGECIAARAAGRRLLRRRRV